MRTLALLLCLLPAALPAPGRAGEPVDLALVLVSDVSRSVDDGEYRLQKDGYATAFRDPRVAAAVRGGAVGAVALAYVEFAGASEVRTVLDWRVVRDAADLAGMAEEMQAAPRSFWGRTSISAGIDRATQMLAEMPFEAQRRTIDVAGDGTNNAGREVQSARDEALSAGITINGLAIVNDNPAGWAFAHVQPPGGLTEWFRQNVAGGPGHFVLEVNEFAAFGEAMTRKLVSEIASVTPGQASGLAAVAASRRSAGSPGASGAGGGRL